MEAAVATQWQRIETHLRSSLGHATAAWLNPGATEDEIAFAETSLQVRFPDDLRFSLLRHNGQATHEVLVGMGPLLSTLQMVEQWRIWKQVADEGCFEGAEDVEPGVGVKAQWWNPRWVPVTHDGGGDHDCVDLDPHTDAGGSVGQVMEMWHDDGRRALSAPSFLAWIRDCADQLEDGRLAWEEGSGFLSTADRR